MSARWRLSPLAVCALALTTILAPALAPAAQPRTTLSDIEGEVMCPICGTLLELANSPQADREKVFIVGLIVKGDTRAQIKDALVAQYGPEVLALPRASGFDLSAYLVPVIGFAAAALALALGVLRWRRRAGPPGSDPPTARGPTGEEAERLDADLARYDL
ncbi:MAG TPA: cytochrome c-type biogenesis protein CcmH [Solirubrobacterales bacterium]|nr:cytochrome c-type biogenesis protein CcmH [Solirubrobacterales bacterium]